MPVQAQKSSTILVSDRLKVKGSNRVNMDTVWSPFFVTGQSNIAVVVFKYCPKPDCLCIDSISNFRSSTRCLPYFIAKNLPPSHASDHFLLGIIILYSIYTCMCFRAAYRKGGGKRGRKTVTFQIVGGSSGVIMSQWHITGKGICGHVPKGDF